MDEKHNIKPANKETLTGQTLRGFFWLSSSSGLQALIQVGVMAVLARLVSPDDFGIANVALILVGFANLISQLGVGPAIVQRENLNKYHIRIGFTLSIFMGLILGLATFFTSSYVALFFGMNGLTEVLKFISVIFVIESFVVVSESLLQREMKLKEYSLAQLISYIIGYGIIGILLGYKGYGVWALVSAFVSQSIIKAIIVTYLKPHSVLPSLQKKEFRELIHYGGGFTLGKMANYFAGHGDNIVVGRWLGASALGLYSRAYYMMVTPARLIGTALDKAAFPAMASIQGDVKKMRKAFLKGTYFINLISIPSSIIFYIMAQEFVLVVLGDQWTDAIAPFQILSLGLFFRMGNKLSDSLARATGKVYERSWRQFLYAFSVLGGAYMGQKWGIEGVAWAIICSLTLNYFLMIHLSFRTLDFSLTEFLKTFYQPVIISIFILIGLSTIIPRMRTMVSYSFVVLLINGLILISFAGILYKFRPNYLFGEYTDWVGTLIKK